MATDAQPLQPVPVRLRLADGEWLQIRSFRPLGSGHPSPGAPVDAPEEPPVPAAGLHLTSPPLVALVEAVGCGADVLALTLMEVLAASGYRCGGLSLDGQNRLVQRAGHPAATPAWAWRQVVEQALQVRADRVLIPGPDAAAALSDADVEGVLAAALGAVDGVVADLGCRWAPHLFRPVLTRATHIWLLAAPGQWTALEMRLEQAELSGWTPMERVKILMVGDDAKIPADWAAHIAAVLPDVTGPAAREFVRRELGGQEP